MGATSAALLMKHRQQQQGRVGAGAGAGGSLLIGWMLLQSAGGCRPASTHRPWHMSQKVYAWAIEDRHVPPLTVSTVMHTNMSDHQQ